MAMKRPKKLAADDLLDIDIHENVVEDELVLIRITRRVSTNPLDSIYGGTLVEIIEEKEGEFQHYPNTNEEEEEQQQQQQKHFLGQNQYVSDEHELKCLAHILLASVKTGTFTT